MPEVRFTKLQILADESRSNTKRQCASSLSRGKYCEERISRDASEAQRLHDKLRDEKGIDQAARTKILKEIAELTLCDVHDEDEDITAAVKQWENEIASRTTAEEPQTPKTKSGANPQQILFQVSPNAKKLEEPKKLDAEIRRVLAGNIEIQDKKETSLYIFSYERAPGVYKFGKTNDLDRRTGEHEKCYPGLEMRTHLACPNAGLFERVVQAELSRYRRSHICDKCEKKNNKKTTHIEWFEAPLKTIQYVASAWSLYATMLYEHGLSVDANHQRLPLRGFSTREDRWCRWALGEATRWMDKNPNPTAALPKIPVLDQVNETDDTDASDSEAESTFSSPESLADTPGTTPANSPGSYGDENDDYGLSPSPTERYTKAKPAAMVEEDEGDSDDDDDDDFLKGTKKPTKRALFVPSNKAQNGLSRERARSMDTQSLPSSQEDSAVDTGTDLDPESNRFIENGSSTSAIDNKIRKLLLTRSSHLTKNHGTIYLTAHAEKSSYKIFNRVLDARRENSRDCYSQPAPAFAITCTEKLRIQNLVLAQFKDRVDRYSCGYDGCSVKHFNWINAPLEDIRARLRAWTELFEVGYDTVDIPENGFSQDEDRWTKWAKEMVAAARCEKESKRKERNDKGKNGKKDAGSKGHKAGKAQEEEPSSDSDQERAPVEEPRRIPRAPSNSPSDPDSKPSGNVRPGLIRRMSTRIEQTGKAQMSRVSSFKDKGKKGFGKIVKKLK
ncbi:hypothetical protein BJX65DRAFT_305535 [Aspergillus insuetus]